MTMPDQPNLIAELVNLTDKFRHDDSLTGEESQALSRRIDAIHAEIAAAVRDASVLRSLAAAMYQAAGAYDMPVRFLDVLATAGNGEPITEAQVYALLPCETPDFVRDKERLDWLADPENKVGNVQLPSECVMANLHSLRAAIDSAMRAEEGAG
jgi:hypothetical protein